MGVSEQIYVDLDEKISRVVLIDKLEKSMERLDSQVQKISSSLIGNIPQDIAQEREERMVFVRKKMLEVESQLSFLRSI